MRTLLFTLPVILSLLFSPVALADSPKWKDLSDKEKKALHKHKDKWDKLSKSEKKSLQTWVTIPPAQWKKMKIKFTQWKKLSPAKRKQLIKTIRDYRTNNSKAKKERLRKWQKWVNSLPTPVRNELKQAWKKMSRKERKAYVEKLKKKYP